MSQIIAVHAVLKFPSNVTRNACTLCVLQSRERERERERVRAGRRWTFITERRGD